MTQGEDQKLSVSVEDILAGKRKLKAKAIDISAKNAQVSTTTYLKAQEILNQNPSEELLNKLREGKIKIDKAYRQIKNLQKRQDLLSNSMAEMYYLFFKPLPVGDHTIDYHVIRAAPGEAVENDLSHWNIKVVH